MAKLPPSATDVADSLLATDPRLRALTEKLWRQQRRLKAAAAPELYRLYLDLEETANERLLVLVERVWDVARAHERRRRRAKRRGET